MVNKKIVYALLICSTLGGCTGLFEEIKQAPDDSSRKKSTVQKVQPVKTQPKTQSELFTKPPQTVIRPEKKELHPKFSSPAIVALMSDAGQSTKTGNLDGAAVTIERALRIEPRNSYLLYELAVLRYKQEKYRLAEDLARKSVLLAVGNNHLKGNGWLLISDARLKQGDKQGAAEARKKAAELLSD